MDESVAQISRFGLKLDRDGLNNGARLDVSIRYQCFGAHSSGKSQGRAAGRVVALGWLQYHSWLDSAIDHILGHTIALELPSTTIPYPS